MSKRSLSLLILLIGLIVFSLSAFADLSLASAYVDFKTAIRKTFSASGVSAFGNYTNTTLYRCSLDGKPVLHSEIEERFDVLNGRYLRQSSTKNFERDTEELQIEIEDAQTQQRMIWHSSRQNWYVYQNYPAFRFASAIALPTTAIIEAEADGISGAIGIIGSIDGPTTIHLSGRMGSSLGALEVFSVDPETDPRAQDLERIFDAVVGNLSQLLQAESTLDGGKHYYGSVSGMQLPPLVQALAGLLAKQGALGQVGLPLFSIQISELSGDAIESPEGFLTRCEVQLRFSWSDGEGQSHQGVIDFGMNLSAIGTTGIELPDLNEDNALFFENGWKVPGPNQLLQEKDFGLYRSNYLLETDASWDLVALRYLELQEEDGVILGHYWEESLDYRFATPLDFRFRMSNTQVDRWYEMVEMNEYAVVREMQHESLYLECNDTYGSLYFYVPRDMWSFGYHPLGTQWNRVFE